MRILLVAAVLCSPVPALGLDMEAYRAARAAERQAEYASASARQKARCDRLGGVRIGLNAEGVLKSCWGKPLRINTTTTAGASREQWVYDTGYVYLTAGIVTAVQTSR